MSASVETVVARDEYSDRGCACGRRHTHEREERERAGQCADTRGACKSLRFSSAVFGGDSNAARASGTRSDRERKRRETRARGRRKREEDTRERKRALGRVRGESALVCYGAFALAN